jgi:hypothetical protein
LYIIRKSGCVAPGYTGAGEESKAFGEIQDQEFQEIDVYPKSTDPVYQDTGFVLNMLKANSLINADLASAMLAADNKEWVLLAGYGNLIITDTQQALTESQSYDVSPKLQPAKEEWESALVDYNAAGGYLVQFAHDGQISSMNLFSIKCTSGTDHLKKTTALLSI